MTVEPEVIPSAIEALKEILTPMGETVWTAYMRQMVFEGAMHSVILFALFLLATYIAYKAHCVIKEYNEEHNAAKDEIAFDYGVLLIVYGIFGAVLLEMLSICILKVVNPEYYVIQDILNSLGL